MPPRITREEFNRQKAEREARAKAAAEEKQSEVSAALKEGEKQEAVGTVKEITLVDAITKPVEPTIGSSSLAWASSIDVSNMPNVAPISQPLSGLSSNIFVMPPAPESLIHAATTTAEETTKKVDKVESAARYSALEKEHSSLKEKYDIANTKIGQLQSSVDELEKIREQATLAQVCVM